MGERRRDMVGTCTAHWILLTRGLAFMVGFLLLLWSGMGHAAEALSNILRGYPETLSHCCGEITQPPGGNEMEDDHRVMPCSAYDEYDRFGSWQPSILGYVPSLYCSCDTDHARPWCVQSPSVFPAV